MSKRKLISLTECERNELEMLVAHLRVSQPKMFGIFPINFKKLLRGIPDHGIEPTRENLFTLRQYASVERQWEFTVLRTPHHGTKEITSERASIDRLFRWVELASRILPLKAQKNIFEPAFNDAKKQYLRDRRKYRSNSARKWLTFCFIAQIVLMVCQCFLSMCGGRVGRTLFSFASDCFRRLLP